MSDQEFPGWAVITAQFSPAAFIAFDETRRRVKEITDHVSHVPGNEDKTLDVYYTSGGAFDLLIVTDVREACSYSISVALSRTGLMRAISLPATTPAQIDEHEATATGIICC